MVDCLRWYYARKAFWIFWKPRSNVELWSMRLRPKANKGKVMQCALFTNSAQFWTLADWCEKCFASSPHLRQSTLWGWVPGDIGQVYRNKPCLASKKILFVRDWRLLASRRKQNKVEAVNPREAILDLGVLFPCTMTLFYHIHRSNTDLLVAITCNHH